MFIADPIGCQMLNGVSGAWLPIVSLPDDLFNKAPSHLGVRLARPDVDGEWARTLDIQLKPPRTTMTMNLDDVLEIAQVGRGSWMFFSLPSRDPRLWVYIGEVG